MIRELFGLALITAVLIGILCGAATTAPMVFVVLAGIGCWALHA